MQFIRPAQNDNAGLMPGDITKHFSSPGNVQGILKTSCYDCHSNNTHYPWYAHVQPVGWFLANHIKEGKEELNFSEFGTYSTRRKQSKLKAIASSVKDGSMPLSSYTYLHGDAKLSSEAKVLIITWAINTADSMATKN